jgi:hypothetical protein
MYSRDGKKAMRRMELSDFRGGGTREEEARQRFFPVGLPLPLPSRDAKDTGEPDSTPSACGRRD